MKAIIFDMDGVIIDSEPIAKKIMIATCKKLGVALKDAELRKLIGTNSKRIWSYIKSAYDLPKNVEYYRSLYDEDLEIKEYENLSIDKELLDFLNLLKDFDIKVGLATSASRKRMHAVLEQFRINKYFQATVSEDEVVESKPDPGIYLLTAEKLGVNPNDCFVIEDTDSGIQAATDAGMKCLLYNKYTPIGDLSKEALLVFSSFAKLQSKIITILNG